MFAAFVSYLYIGGKKIYVHNNLVLHLQPILLGLKYRLVRELCQGGKPGTGNCIMMFVYVAPPTLVHG